jgi:hypothetical protein
MTVLNADPNTEALQQALLQQPQQTYLQVAKSFIPADATNVQQQPSVKPTTNPVVVMGMPNGSGAPINNVTLSTMTVNSNVAGQVPNVAGQTSNVPTHNVGLVPNVTVLPNVGIIGNGVPTAICSNMQASNLTAQPAVPTTAQNTLATGMPNGIPTMVSNSGAMTVPNGHSSAVPNAMHGLVGMSCVHLLRSFACMYAPVCLLWIILASGHACHAHLSFAWHGTYLPHLSFNSGNPGILFLPLSWHRALPHLLFYLSFRRILCLLSLHLACRLPSMHFISDKNTRTHTPLCQVPSQTQSHLPLQTACRHLSTQRYQTPCKRLFQITPRPTCQTITPMS